MNQSFFTDEEYRILLSALGRERKVCEQLASKDNDKVLPYIMDSIESKIKRIQYPKYVIFEIGSNHKHITDQMRLRYLFNKVMITNQKWKIACFVPGIT